MSLPMTPTSDLGFPDGNFWVKFSPRPGKPGKTTTYGLYGEWLARISQYFEPFVRGAQQNPATQNNPHPLTDAEVGQIEWEAFCLLAFNQHRVTTTNTHSPEWWYLILRAAVPLCADGIIAQAKENLNRLPSLSPILALDLAANYDLASFLPGAFKELLGWCMRGKLTQGFNGGLPPAAYYTLAQTSIKLAVYRQCMVAGGPPPFEEKCMKSEPCKEAWAHEWWQRFGSKVLHPDEPWRLARISDVAKELLEEDESMPNMCWECTQGALTALVSLPTPYKDDVIIQEGLDEMTQHIRGHQLVNDDPADYMITISKLYSYAEYLGL
ncbi:hypothetical protein CYLTODRAFT_494925 [Cylindrobasidium torrendii FP15055 ss-10]|uniref:Uncharacterized protein n=1 Tax=Cylindrobasidium torrendii FP15055 ss-10 TaxID=1314674 RepID=A0A0D7AUG7_9AGAR|nr:hypothetical protein CYLTODRAFT_494925 [Cylindrobasidium torrendii FP15055 ss-10]